MNVSPLSPPPVYLATQGQNPQTHLVKRELVRVCALTVSHLV